MEGNVLTSQLLRHLAQGQLNNIPPSEAFPYTNEGSKFMPMPGVHQVCTQGLNHSVHCLKAHTVLLPSGHRNLILPTPGTAKALGIIRTLALPFSAPTPASRRGLPYPEELPLSLTPAGED